MARDRKRAKQRRRRRGGEPLPSERLGANSATAGSPDPVDDELRDRDVPPPPLEDSSGEVDIARASMVDPPEARLDPDELPEPEDDLDPEPLDEPEPLEPVDPDDSAVGAGEGADREPSGTGVVVPAGAGDYADPQRARREATGDPAAAQGAPPEGNRFANFIRGCVAELRRVQWPDRRQVGQATGVVLGFVVLAGAYLGALDALWSRVVELIL